MTFHNMSSVTRLPNKCLIKLIEIYKCWVAFMKHKLGWVKDFYPYSTKAFFGLNIMGTHAGAFTMQTRAVIKLPLS